MADATEKSKWAFWSMIGAVFVFATVPSWVLVESIEEYRTFFMGSRGRPLKTSVVSRTPRHDGEEAREFNFVEFRLAAPEARRVTLAGSFNGWRAGTLDLAHDKGVWKVVIPLPPGTYQYAFHVDGAWRADPSAGQTLSVLGHEASMRKVP